jgi:hypothetical protein
MIFHARRERALARIEATLIRSDPALAAEFERFNTLTRSSRGGRERRPVAKRLLALVVLPLAALFMVWATVTGAGNPEGSGRCFAVTGAACPPSRPACRAASAPLSRGSGAHLCGTQSPRIAP